MSPNAIYLPQVIQVGAGASARLVEVLAQLGVAKPLIISDPFLQEMGYIEKLVAPLAAAHISYGSFSDCVADPTTSSVAAALAYWHSGDFDCVVALGGGSSIDTAKAVAVLAKHGGHMRDYKVPKLAPAGVPIIAIPTTAGTGSEATRVVVITDTQSQEKMLCMGIGFMPTAAVVDYELSLSMPVRLTADTGIDSLCHAMEAYVSRKANGFTDPIALASMTAIAANIRLAYNEPDNHVAREAMMLAALQGGIAFSNASVTLIHGMSRPLGAFFHIPHGLSNAMLITAITEYSLNGAIARYADCSRAMGFASSADSDKTAGALLVDNLYLLCADLAIPTLKTFGLNEQQYRDKIPIMSKQALASGSPNNNPIVPSQTAIEALYSIIWG